MLQYVKNKGGKVQELKKAHFSLFISCSFLVQYVLCKRDNDILYFKILYNHQNVLCLLFGGFLDEIDFIYHCMSLLVLFCTSSKSGSVQLKQMGGQI